MHAQLPKQNKTVIVGMSGGVDSSVSALLLKQQGFNPIGLYMKNWHEPDANGVCPSVSDYEDVANTCAKIGIPYYSVNFVEEYRQFVFDEFIADYKKGLTPNPDILCNREIKFKFFYEKALALGADYIATGHYCQTQDGRLLKGKDQSKDQSYFLCAIDAGKLLKVLFPVGGLVKSEVREIARQHGLPTSDKKDSTGICFVGERRFQPFLAQYIKSEPGDFCTLDGKAVGRHHGAPFYTVGQRKHLGLGGAGNPWYVVKKDMERNIVYVERDHDHPELFRTSLFANNAVWLVPTPTIFPFSCKAKVRYRQEDQDCTVMLLSDGRLQVDFAKPQRAIAPSQAVVFYDGDVCLGGATILEAFNR